MHATQPLAFGAAAGAAAAAAAVFLCWQHQGSHAAAPAADAAGAKPYITVLRDDRTAEAEADPALAAALDMVRNPDGTLDNIMSIHSLNPATLHAHAALYTQCMKGESPLSLADRELVAVAASLTNSCTCARPLLRAHAASACGSGPPGTHGLTPRRPCMCVADTVD